MFLGAPSPKFLDPLLVSLFKLSSCQTITLVHGAAAPSALLHNLNILHTSFYTIYLVHTVCTLRCRSAELGFQEHMECNNLPHNSVGLGSFRENTVYTSHLSHDSPGHSLVNLQKQQFCQANHVVSDIYRKHIIVQHLECQMCMCIVAVNKWNPSHNIVSSINSWWQAM